MPSTPLLQKLHDQLAQAPKDNPAAAQKIIEEYFSCYSPAFANNQLWTLLAGTLSNELEEQTGAQRHNYIFFFEYTQLLIQAAYRLHCLQAPAGISTK